MEKKISGKGWKNEREKNQQELNQLFDKHIGKCLAH